MAKIILIFLMYLTHLLMSYGASISPYRALLGSLIIVGFAWVIWRSACVDVLGLRIPQRDAVLAVVLTPLMLLLFWGMVVIVVSARDIAYQSPYIEHGFLSATYLHTLGQTLNEEMLFGALILFALRRKIGTDHSTLIAVVVAFIFALMHYVFYRWIVISDNHGILGLAALFVLFVIGVARNGLILKTDHIAYAWALHFSINTVGLGGNTHFPDGTELTEPQVLNTILGSPLVVILSIVILLSVWLFFRVFSSQTFTWN